MRISSDLLLLLTTVSLMLISGSGAVFLARRAGRRWDSSFCTLGLTLFLSSAGALWGTLDGLSARSRILETFGVQHPSMLAIGLASTTVLTGIAGTASVVAYLATALTAVLFRAGSRDELQSVVRQVASILLEDKWRSIEDPRRLLVALLSDTLRMNPERLAYTVMPTRLPFRDVTVCYALCRTATDSLSIEYDLRFRTDASEVVIAVTHSIEQQLAIAAVCPDVSYVLVTRSPAESKQLHKSLLEHGPDHSVILEATNAGVAANTRMTLKPVIGKHVKRYLPLDAQNVYLVRGEIPAAERSSVVHLHTRFTLSWADGFVYWIADRPMWLSSLTFAFEGFGDEKKSVSVHPFLPGIAAAGELERPSSNLVKIEASTWVLAGHGALVRWEV